MTCDQEVGLSASRSFKKFCNFYDIQLKCISTRFSQSNGCIERIFWFLKKGCRLVAAQKLSEWDKFLPFLTHAINSRILSYGFSSEELTFYNTIRKLSPIELGNDYANYETYIKDVFTKIREIRKQHVKAKTNKIRSNLNYINKRRKNRKFEVGSLCFYKNLRVQKGMSIDRILYKPGIIIENLPSGTHCYIQSLVSNKILKYSFQYLKPVKDLSRLSRLALPLEWQKLIVEKIPNYLSNLEEDSDVSENTTDEDVIQGPHGFGSSQESLISIRLDRDSSEESSS